MGHPDFRVRGKIFASLGYPDDAWGMVKLTPAEQELFVGADPTVFMAVKGGWGRRGSTNIRLEAANEVLLHSALLAAWRYAAPRPPSKL